MTNTETALNVTTHAATIYTDGSCLSNPGPGGWSAIILRDNSEPQEISGGTVSTTNNRMELIAVVEAIKTISPITAPVTIISDSQYVINGMTTWLSGWKAKGWRNAAKAPVKNQDLWEILDSLNTPLITWTWVKGHAGNEWNERADVLANTAAQQAANLNAA